MWARRIGLALLAGAVVGALALSGALHRESRAYTGGEEWFVEFDYQVVPPVQGSPVDEQSLITSQNSIPHSNRTSPR